MTMGFVSDTDPESTFGPVKPLPSSLDTVTSCTWFKLKAHQFFLDAAKFTFFKIH